MPSYKCSAFFTFEGQGWTESLFTTKNNHVAAYNAFKKVLDRRVEFLSQSCAIDYVRVSDDAIRGDGVASGFDAGQLAGRYPGGTETAETCFEVRLESDANTRRIMQLRGVGDTLIQDKKIISAGKGTFTTKYLQPWFATLTNQGMQIRTSGVGGLRVPITAYDIDYALRKMTLTLQIAVPGLEVGDWVTVRGVRGYSPSINGRVRVAGLTVGNTVLSITPAILPTGVPWGVGTVEMLTFAYENITDYSYLRVGNRKTGRPFFQSRGRARNR